MLDHAPAIVLGCNDAECIDQKQHHAISESQQAALEAEYEMVGGKLIVTKRLSQSFYLMTEHNLDVAPDTLPPAKQQLVLLNRDEVVNARTTARKLSIDAIERASR
jgi:hypothetical protein